MKIGVYKVAMAAPNDVAGLAQLIDSGQIDPAEIVALIGKTEGNGGANDFTRGFATLSGSLQRRSASGLHSSGQAVPKASLRRMRRSSRVLRPKAGPTRRALP